MPPAEQYGTKGCCAYSPSSPLRTTVTFAAPIDNLATHCCLRKERSLHFPITPSSIERKLNGP